ncbi:Ig-like domain-containing protein [Aequorivita marisscotiae]|uniref:Ig-like domain-containing protein n=1 Tax=Aequorivita marisscotiae TaxID=3040348 RepID=A0ABY8KVT2_9FLAO|nr:Ig-like domain-containing protein [Aequorivita sp. Ant34-E75]WGF93266.1 Ig-like domain-containing protein [Aequorivita sp. Ant34-E75]
MKHRLLYIAIAFLFMLSFVDCAKKGSPSGGPRDTIPPVIVRSIPENFTTNFTGSEIEIRFDEYIKLKDIAKELIISPPMKYAPIITPLSTSKTLKIKIIDTLKPNTTYSFNFGNSIVDNNEENKFEYYKYIFSTGSYIDSLKVAGSVKYAQLITPEIPTTVMLYEINETFKDSVVYFEKPTYITVTKDSTGTFELSNLKEGQYLLMALKEKNNDYTFQPKNDKIGFVKELITLPTDTTYTITLFKEIPDYKFTRGSQIGNNHIVFGYEGRAENLNISTLSEMPESYVSTFFKDETKDTLHYWFKPTVQVDSLRFKISNNSNIDTATVRMRELYKDSLTITAIKTGTVKLKDTFQLRANTPLISYNASKFEVMANDSTFVETSIKLNEKYNRAEVYFSKTEDESYTVKLLPGALTDFFEKTNDTLEYKVSTRLNSEYGTLSLTLVNAAQWPLIVQLQDSKYKLVAEEYLTEDKTVLFEALLPDKYFLRIIYDENQNGRWDAGSFLNRMEPEKIIYYPRQIEVRANWSLNETFTLK